ncbi:MAG: NAD(P)-dependent oxidoreductase [Micrococcales bacterium]|nr:NAD(P)-dependent oxidoreductase [Micrococcales bacterium]
MKFLVTGGLGLIGHNVVQRLQKRGDDVVIVDNRTTYGIIPQDELDYLMAERWKKINPTDVYYTDIVDGVKFDQIVKNHKPEVIIHMASFPRQKVVNANPAVGARVMMEGLMNICEGAKKHGVERVVYISSSMVYGDFADQVEEEAECRPIGQYGIMKLAGEDIVKDYHRRGAFDYAIVRPSAVYGPLDVEDRVVAKFMLQAMRGDVLRVNGAAETLDFTYVDDAADGIVAAATRIMAANRTYNITKSHSVSLLEAAEMIVKIVGKGTIECRDRDADFPTRGALCIDRARVILGFDPKVDVEEGFQNYYKWLSESPYWNK